MSFGAGSFGTGPDAPQSALAAAGKQGPAVTLRGLDAMAFSTEVLPLLEGRDDVRVEVDGQVPDYHEAGDSLEIGVSAGERDGDRDWFDLGITVTVEGREVPFTDLFVALAHGQSHLLLADGAYFSLDKPELAALARLIGEARALQDQPDEALRISRFQAGLWEELAALGVVGHQAAAWQAQVRGLLSVDHIDAVPVPATVNARLRPYQVAGFQWLAFLWSHGLGGILADDMGLGKTLQALALLQHAKDTWRDGENRPPFLIVAPTSVLTNWSAEARRFAPDLAVTVVSDTLGRRGGTLADVTAGADAVVTSYTLLRLDLRGLRRAAVGRADPGRGAVRQELPVQGVPVRAPGARAVQGGDHRHADGEQPHGAVVAAVDRRARAVPEPGPVQGLLRAANREVGERRAAVPAAPPDQAADHAQDQGAGRRGPAGEAGAGARRSSCTRGTGSCTRLTCSASGRRCSACSMTSTTTGSPSCGR